MTKQRTITTVILFTAVLLCTADLPADDITIGITAQIYSINDPHSFLEGNLNVSDIITGYYTYNSDVPDNNPLDSVGDYWHGPQGPYGMFLEAGGFSFQTHPQHVRFVVEIIDDYTFTFPYTPLDGYTLKSEHNLPLPNGATVSTIGWMLRDDSGSALSSTEPPLVAPNLSDWPTLNRLGILGSFSIRAEVTSAWLIPEPATILLLAFGLPLIRRKKPARKKMLRL